jgi:hypothetical protein
MSYKWKIIVPECMTPDQDIEELGDLSGPEYQHLCERGIGRAWHELQKNGRLFKVARAQTGLVSQ